MKHASMVSYDINHNCKTQSKYDIESTKDQSFSSRVISYLDKFDSFHAVEYIYRERDMTVPSKPVFRKIFTRGKRNSEKEVMRFRLYVDVSADRK